MIFSFFQSYNLALHAAALHGKSLKWIFRFSTQKPFHGFRHFQEFTPFCRILKTSVCASKPQHIFRFSTHKNPVSSDLILLFSFAIVCFPSHSSRIRKISLHFLTFQHVFVSHGIPQQI